MYGYIYKTTNLITGKIYVGQKRASTFDTNYYGSGVRITNLLNKFGKEDFEIELLEECQSEQELNEREIYWIKTLNATDRNVGYNLMDGGYKVRGTHHSLETKKKISKSKTGKHPNRDYTNISQDTKNKISNTLKKYYETHDNPRKGVHLSDETKQKLRKANLGKKYSEETCAKHRGKPAWNRGVSPSEETKEKLRQANLGKRYSEETKEKHRQLWLGENNPNYGGLKEETKEKIRQAIKGRIWITKGDVHKQIISEELEFYISKGFHRGRK